MRLKLILHTVVMLALLAAYVALTVAGHDGNAVLALMAGQGIGGAVSELPGKVSPP